MRGIPARPQVCGSVAAQRDRLGRGSECNDWGNVRAARRPFFRHSALQTLFLARSGILSRHRSVSEGEWRLARADPNRWLAQSWRGGACLARSDVTPDFSAVLLAGGKSRRMGRDKAFVEIKGVPLWKRQLRILDQLAPAEILLAGPSHPEWNDVGCRIVADARAEAGPLGGLVAALRCCSTALLLALAVDLPQMTSDYLRQLLKLCQRGRGVVPIGGPKRFEPLVAVYPRSALGIGEELLANGQYSMQNFANLCLVRGLTNESLIAPAEVLLFLNMNTAGDLATVCGRNLATLGRRDIAS